MSVALTARPAVRGVAPVLQRVAFVALLAVAVTVPRMREAPFPAVFDAWSLLPFCALVLVVLVDVRRPLQLSHLDLLVFLSLVLSIAFEGGSRWVLSMLLLYPQLVYLAARTFVLARVRHVPVAGLRSQFPRSWLVVGMLVLIAVHVAWELPAGTYMDVASDSIHGALRIVHGLPLYVRSPPGSVTYGPSNFLAYIPFATLISNGDTAARLTTIAFTMLTAALLFLLGRRERGTDAGMLLAFCWLALPFTLYEDATGFNDSLVAASLVATLLCIRRPRSAGAAAAIAGWTKLAPLALVPLLAIRRSRGDIARFAGAFAVTTGLLFVPAFAHSTPSAFISQTFGYQATRLQTNSIWAVLFHLSSTHHAHWVITVSAIVHTLTIAIAVATALLLPRARLRDDLAGIAAASAAILLLFELSLNYFAFSYILWFAPLVLITLVLGHAPAKRGDTRAHHATRALGDGRRSLEWFPQRARAGRVQNSDRAESLGAT
jgi:hypothetical protein